MTSTTESTEAIVCVGPPPHDETTDISDGVPCYKVQQVHAQMWAHLRLRCLAEREFELAKTSWLHEALTKEECEREFARRRPTANAANLMSEGETPPAAQWSTPAAVRRALARISAGAIRRARCGAILSELLDDRRRRATSSLARLCPLRPRSSRRRPTPTGSRPGYPTCFQDDAYARCLLF